MKENCKYFVADEEVFFGDVISTELEKNVENHVISREIEFTLTEETLPLALALGIVESREAEEEETPECEECIHEELINDFCDELEGIEKRLTKLEEKVAIITELMKPKSKTAKPDTKK